MAASPERLRRLPTVFHQPLLAHIHAVCQHLVPEASPHLDDIDGVSPGQFPELPTAVICTVRGNCFPMLAMAGGVHGFRVCIYAVCVYIYKVQRLTRLDFGQESVKICFMQVKKMQKSLAVWNKGCTFALAFRTRALPEGEGKSVGHYLKEFIERFE